MRKLESTTPKEIVNNNFYVNTKQILMIFGITRTTFDKWRKKNFPKAIFITTRPLWKTSDVIQWASSFSKKSH
jgi:predicted DNA-binding transcriptional regulator AlpA